MIEAPSYYLVRQRSSPPHARQEAVWEWCLARLSLPVE